MDCFRQMESYSNSLGAWDLKSGKPSHWKWSTVINVMLPFDLGFSWILLPFAHLTKIRSSPDLIANQWRHRITKGRQIPISQPSTTQRSRPHWRAWNRSRMLSSCPPTPMIHFCERFWTSRKRFYYHIWMGLVGQAPGAGLHDTRKNHGQHR